MSALGFAAFQFALLEPCMAMTSRGLRVDDLLRQERIKLLSEQRKALHLECLPAVEAIKGKLKKPHLFFKSKVCKGCRNGKKKKLACAACGGAGKSEAFIFNPGSDSQLKDVLYNGLRLPTRTHNGKATVDEEALQSLVALDTSGLVLKFLRYAKVDTLVQQYERIEPAADGHVRTAFNPAGTYTGRFNSQGAFYVPYSTNLQNLTEAEGRRDPLYVVRDCIVPDPGEYFLYADLSQVEARISALLADDTDLLERWSDPKWDVHRWTASHLFGVPESAVTDPQRYLGKRCRHALNYGMGPNKLWRTINSDADVSGVAITLGEAQRLWKAYHALHPKLDAVWWDRVQMQLKRNIPIVAGHCGWSCTFYPRFDYYTKEPDAETLRKAVAWEPQHTAVHVLNEGLLNLWKAERGNGYRLLSQQHDAILAGVHKERWREVAERFKRTLERSVTIRGRTLMLPVEVFLCRERWSQKERVY